MTSVCTASLKKQTNWFMDHRFPLDCNLSFYPTASWFRFFYQSTLRANIIRSRCFSSIAPTNTYGTGYFECLTFTRSKTSRTTNVRIIVFIICQPHGSDEVTDVVFLHIVIIIIIKYSGEGPLLLSSHKTIMRYRK